MKSSKGCLIFFFLLILGYVFSCINDSGKPDTFLQQTESTSWTVNTLPVQTSFAGEGDFNGVSNPDTLLAQDEVDIINSNILALRNLDVQMLVIMVNRFSEPDNSHDFCMEIGRKYGIGTRDKNLGVVMLVALETHDWSIVTGRGMEKYLTDLECNAVAEEIMVPELREGNYGLALIKGVEAIRRICEGEITADEAVAGNIVGFSSAGGYADNSQVDDSVDGSDWVCIIIFALVVFCLAFFGKSGGGGGGGSSSSGSSGSYYSSGSYSSSSYGGGSFGGGGASGKW